MRLVRDEPIDDEPMHDEDDELNSITDETDEDVAARERDERSEIDEQPDGTVVDETDHSDDGEVASAAMSRSIDLQSLEALLFSTHHPLTAGRLAELLDLESTKPIRAAIKSLNEQYDSGNRAFRIEQVAGGYQLLTLPTFGDLLKKFHQKEGDAKLTKAALETLAIIAYKQPILRADIEAIRGVACGETIRSLMEKHLVKIAGRAEEPGRPILYGTTKRFLELFGLNSLKELPQNEDSKAFAPPTSQQVVEETDTPSQSE
jgi:segregation and condensation protein B